MKNYTSVLLRNEINILVVIKSSIGNISRVAVIRCTLAEWLVLWNLDRGVRAPGLPAVTIRDLPQNTTATATTKRTSPNKGFNKQINGCASAL